MCILYSIVHIHRYVYTDESYDIITCIIDDKVRRERGEALTMYVYIYTIYTRVQVTSYTYWILKLYISAETSL